MDDISLDALDPPARMPPLSLQFSQVIVGVVMGGGISNGCYSFLVALRWGSQVAH